MAGRCDGVVVMEVPAEAGRSRLLFGSGETLGAVYQHLAGGASLDEAPQVYRRLAKVLEAQGDTITIKHVLQPLVVVMAGANEIDPYKD